jgi:hypothetical protein
MALYLADLNVCISHKSRICQAHEPLTSTSPFRSPPFRDGSNGSDLQTFASNESTCTEVTTLNITRGGSSWYLASDQWSLDGTGRLAGTTATTAGLLCLSVSVITTGTCRGTQHSKLVSIKKVDAHCLLERINRPVRTTTLAKLPQSFYASVNKRRECLIMCVRLENTCSSRGQGRYQSSFAQDTST